MRYAYHDFNFLAGGCFAALSFTALFSATTIVKIKVVKSRSVIFRNNRTYLTITICTSLSTSQLSETDASLKRPLKINILPVNLSDLNPVQTNP